MEHICDWSYISKINVLVFSDISYSSNRRSTLFLCTFIFIFSFIWFKNLYFINIFTGGGEEREDWTFRTDVLGICLWSIRMSTLYIYFSVSFLNFIFLEFFRKSFFFSSKKTDVRKYIGIALHQLHYYSNGISARIEVFPFSLHLKNAFILLQYSLLLKIQCC